MVLRGIGVTTSPPFVEAWGVRVELFATTEDEATSQYVRGPNLMIAQFPRQGPPEDMEPMEFAVGEKAAWRRDETTIEPPDSDQTSSSFAFYLIHVGDGSITVQVSTPPGELPSDGKIRDMVRSMFR